MGSDNIKSDAAKERRAERKATRKLAKNSSRTSETKKVLERILIVSEGEKTEPIYFDQLIEYFKLNTTDIEVTGAKDSCPKKVVEYSIALYEKAVKNNREYDIVFCVIDKDSHPNYANALSHAKAYSPKVLYIINSIPCFELWLLLHYIYTTKPFSKTERKSICDTVIDDLKTHLKNYEKNISTLDNSDLKYIFNDDNIQTAISRAERLMKYCDNTNTDNPSTKIHELVKKLQEIRDDKKKILIY